MGIRTSVTGQNQVARSIEGLPAKLAQRFDSYAKANADQWLAQLKGVIHVVVYDTYEPQKYRRNFKLVSAASKEVSRFRGISSGSLAVGVMVDLFNDTSKVQPTRPKGGAQAWKVPHQIETGDYPPGWSGYSLPRPAYQIFSDYLRPKVEADANQIVSEVIGEK